MLELIPIFEGTPSYGEVSRFVKHQVVLQQNEEDCGAACLAAIAKYYGRVFTLNRLRELIGTNQQGTTLLGLKQGAEAIGFNARSVRAAPEILDQLEGAPLPAIIHWKGYHWVVLYGKRGKKFMIADPAVGMRYISQQELAQSWTDWICLLVEPDPERFLAPFETGVATHPLQQWLKRLWFYRQGLSQVFLLNTVLGLLSLALPFLIQILTDDVLVRGDINLLNSVAIAVIIMTLFSSVLELIQSNIIAHFAQRLELGLVMEFGRKLLHLPLNYYETHRSGEVVNRFRDIQDMNQLVSQFLVSLPSQCLIAAVSFSLMSVYSPSLTTAASLMAVIMTISTLICLPSLRQKTRNLLALEAETQGVLVETFKGAITLKSTTSTTQLWDEFQNRFGRRANLTFRTHQIGILNTVFSGFIGNSGSIILLWLGSHLVIHQSLSIGQLLAIISLNQNVIHGVSGVLEFIDDLTRVQTITTRISDVIDATPETKGDRQKPDVKIASRADIICTDLIFHYGGRVNLLENFSVTFPGGKVTALIGNSGCGKSTLAKLIAGLYPISSGNIRIGIYNLQDLALDSWRRQVVLVPQDAHFWSRSILENFRLGNPEIRFEQIVLACQISGADEFISQLPDKYQTILGEFGANLSVGQRQKLAIARGIVNDPPILILDESTAGLDPVSEAKIIEQLLYHRRGKTTLIISHRPRMINRADWIVYLDNGRLKRQGSLKDLQSQKGEHLDFLIP